MKWNKLKDYKCPKCLEDLTRNIETKRFECLSCGEFSISEVRFNELITQEFHRKKKEPTSFIDEDDNLSRLNNLGREKVKKSFID